MSLSDMRIRSAKARDKRYSICDGGGLYLEIMTTGKKYWRLRYSNEGKANWHSIGEYPSIGLQEARERRNVLRQQIRDGIMPNAAKPENTFREIALEWVDMHDSKITNESDRIKNRNRMNNHLLPFLGDKKISTITATEILPVLKRLADLKKYEQLSRIRSIISQIFRYAVATGRANSDPTYALKGAIIAPKPKHLASLTKPSDVAMLLRSIDAYPYPIIRMAMQFSALVFLRPGEVRHMEWADIEGNELRIPEQKMKMKRPHIVPLAAQTLELLQKMQQLTGHGKYVFPSSRAPRGDRPMSENTVLVALRAMGYTKDQMTPHGFRSMASTLLNENGFNRDWIERQLAHVEGNNVRAAYNYAEYLPERRKMMQWWADYLDELRKGRPAGFTN
jgi:integrase